MNLDNVDLVKLREDIFDQYRNSRKELFVLADKDRELNQQINELHEKMAHKHQEQSMLRSIIDIMLEEDCDPVTAKLKYSERIKAKESEEVIQTTTGYGYKYSDKLSVRPSYYDDH